MSGKQGKQQDADIFESVRKPTAPPSRRMKDKKASAKADPASRKSKHKKRIEENGDI